MRNLFIQRLIPICIKSIFYIYKNSRNQILKKGGNMILLCNLKYMNRNGEILWRKK